MPGIPLDPPGPIVNKPWFPLWFGKIGLRRGGTFRAMYNNGYEAFKPPRYNPRRNLFGRGPRWYQ